MIKQIVLPMVLVGLPIADDVNSTSISKLDYTIPYTDCQQAKFKNTMEHNYIREEDTIKEKNLEWSRVLP